MPKTRVGNEETRRGEREASERLQGIPITSNQAPQNYRDASNPRVERPLDPKINVDIVPSSGKWRNAKPTPVKVPGQPAHKRPVPPKGLGPKPNNNNNATATPWSISRMSNTLNGHSRSEIVGNHTARVGILRTQPLKKQKTEHYEYSGGNGVVQSRYFDNAEAGPSRGPGTKQRAPSNGNKPEVIDITDDPEEDTGTVLQRPRTSSPDPLNSFESSNAGEPTRHPPPDGPATSRFKKKMNDKAPDRDTPMEVDAGGLLDDPIENVPDPAPSEKGYVKSAVAKIDATSVREVNFLKLPSRPIIARMKGKPVASTTLQASPNELTDPQATAPSGYFSNTATKKQNNVKLGLTAIALPLEAWAWGNEIFRTAEGGENYWLHFDKNGDHLSITRGTSGREAKKFSTQEFVQSLEYSNKAGNGAPVVIKIRTHKARKKSMNTARFQLGSAGSDGLITFKFQTDGANWQHGQYYDALIMSLKTKLDTVNKLGASASASCWEMVENACLHVTTFGSKISNGKSAQQAPAPSEDGDTASASTSHRNPMARRVSADTTSLATSRETRSSARLRDSESTRTSPAPDLDEIMFPYPFTGPGAVNITRGDLKRLDPGQYLNDTLIEYGLKLWLDDLREKQPELADQVHLFNSFFYKKINVKKQEEGYKSVRKWTSKIDIFKKKYLVVPINENLHWYLAIICNPEYVLRPPPPKAKKVAAEKPMTRKRKRESEVFQQEAGLLETSVPDADSTLAKDSSSSHTASASVSASVSRQRSPDDGIVPDSESEMVQTQPDEVKRRDEREVEAIVLGDDADETLPRHLQRSLSMSESQLDTPISVEPEMDIDELVLGYPLKEDMNVDADVEDTTSVISVQNPSILSDKNNGSVSVNTFYAKGKPNKGKEKAMQVSPPDQEEDQMTVDPISPDAEQTYIFTFDSLGPGHPKACATLSNYLTMEAKDKKGVEQTSRPAQKTALVPCQPNYCDCGVYVLHFAEKFMADPVRFTHLILTRTPKHCDAKQRGKDWDGDDVADLREKLLGRSIQLEEHWKKMREEVEKKEVAEGTTTTRSTSNVDSDDDVIIAEPSPQSATPKSKGRGRPPGSKNKPTAPPAETGSSVARLRDGKNR